MTKSRTDFGGSQASSRLDEDVAVANCMVWHMVVFQDCGCRASA